MNVLSPDKREQIIHMLLAGFSKRKVRDACGVALNTVIRYSQLIGLVRNNGHRSPISYKHRNQYVEWHQKHTARPPRYDPNALGWQLGACTLAQIKKWTQQPSQSRALAGSRIGDS